jgi:hypothetical protein
LLTVDTTKLSRLLAGASLPEAANEEISCGGLLIGRCDRHGRLMELQCWRPRHDIESQAWDRVRKRAGTLGMTTLAEALPQDTCPDCDGRGVVPFDAPQAASVRLAAISLGSYRGIPFETTTFDELVKRLLSNGFVATVKPAPHCSTASVRSAPSGGRA